MSGCGGGLPSVPAKARNVLPVRAFVTGASGFVGGWLTGHLAASGDVVVGLTDGIDLRSPDLVAEITAAEPEIVYHLAAFSHVGQSWEEPATALGVNALGTLAVLEAARKLAMPPRVMLVSSAEVYGPGDGTPLDEDAALVPVSPYAASKIAAEYVGLQAVIGRGLEVIRVRPFNHVGPGQSEAFVVAALAKRIALAEAAGGGEIAVGNLSTIRDFTDVRDIVRAYRLLGSLGAPGEVYNISSGTTVSVAEILDLLVSLATVPIVPVVDPSLVRPVDVPALTGVSDKMRALTGWKPEIPLVETLRDVLDDARKHL
jgi:GDP-4-dehydro-6-deoxy-D-mannose reductase